MSVTLKIVLAIAVLALAFVSLAKSQPPQVQPAAGNNTTSSVFVFTTEGRTGVICLLWH